MFPQQPQQQFSKAGADVQIFYGDGSASDTKTKTTWSKPVGVSHVYVLMIGAGAEGDGAGTGGGSGAVTVWYVAAKNIPDNLYIWVGTGSTYVSPDISGNNYLIASKALSTVGGVAMAANQLTAMGFFRSVAGQDGNGGSTPAPSATTFLTGGTQRTVTANYGYTNNQNTADGFFQLQPIIVGVAASSTSATRKAGIGCGGAGFGTARPGPGMVLIASW
jgi:hypothetical protein